MLLSDQEKGAREGISVAKLRALNIVIMSFTAFSDHKKLSLSLDALSNLLSFNPLGLSSDVIKTYAEYTDCRNILRKQTENGLRARSLEGIVFTAPYLHNGSVPTQYDLLRPANKRPVTFGVGCRKYDTFRMGYDCAENDPGVEIFDTRLETNSNAGHEYGIHLNHEGRLDLIEYIKSLKNPKRPLRLGNCF